MLWKDISDAEQIKDGFYMYKHVYNTCKEHTWKIQWALKSWFIHVAKVNIQGLQSTAIVVYLSENYFFSWLSFKKWCFECLTDMVQNVTRNLIG